MVQAGTKPTPSAVTSAKEVSPPRASMRSSPFNEKPNRLRKNSVKRCPVVGMGGKLTRIEQYSISFVLSWKIFSFFSYSEINSHS